MSVKNKYLQEDGTAKGTLKHGLKVGKDKPVHEFEMKPVATVKDMFDAEMDAGVDTPLTFNGALMARQLVRIDDYTGPFTLSLIGTLTPADYSILRTAQMELNDAGN
jgi:phage FluMu protein gp41